MKVNVNSTGSPIKWAGGKTWLAPKIWEHYQHHQNKMFIELFAGGLGASFAIKPNAVIAHDANSELINFYQHLKQNPIFDLPMINEEEQYYKYRHEYNELKRSGENNRRKAELFYYLNRCGYNGLYRVNKSGDFNSPFGHYKYSNAKNDLSEYATIIKDWLFENRDFADIVLFDDDFVFIDPPYDTEFTSYTEDGFVFQEQIRLQEFLKDKKCAMISTNQATNRMIELYNEYGWNVEYLSRPRNFRRGKDRAAEGKVEIFAKRNL